MPWSPAQHRLFEAAAHNPAISKARGIPMAKAATMASEGVKATPMGPAPKKHKSTPQQLASALKGMK